MQFYDEVKITIESGRGGDGLASGRRESGVPFGWPNGGDGGKGGDIFFVAKKDLNTLVPYKFRKIFKAEKGEPGRTKDQYGAGGEKLVLEVPVGTLIKNTKTGKLLHHFTKDKEERLALRGGEWGRGNIHFKSPTLQYPNFALMGEPGRFLELTLELQLLGDVALIGNPSVGKTSVINAVAHTKGKVAEYHFTTLIPNLGSVESKGYHFNIIDIPWLIEGASDGKGLGNQFLRHIIKSRVFAFVLDINRYDQGINETLELLEEVVNYIKQKIIKKKHYQCVITEDKGTIDFRVYESDSPINVTQSEAKSPVTATMDSSALPQNDKVENGLWTEVIHKKISFLITKADLLNDEEILEEYKKTFIKKLNEKTQKLFNTQIEQPLVEKNMFFVSAFTHQGLENWLGKMTETLKKTPIPHIHVESQQSFAREEFEMIREITVTEKPKLIEEEYIDEVEAKYLQIWYINHPEIAKLVYTLPRGNDEAEMRFWKQMHEKGFIDYFKDARINKGDILKIKSHYEGLDDRYIVY